MQILLANPRGFCAGVKRAISIVERALDLYGKPIYVRHEVVHNFYVVNMLRQRGVIFIEHIKDVPDGSILIFSAHGVSQLVRTEASSRNLKILDATCPLVTKVHKEVVRASKNGTEAIFIGHNGHPEVEGTMGQYNNPHGGIYLVESLQDILNIKVKNVDNLCFMTQTTLSVNDTLHLVYFLKKRFPSIIGPRKNDICYATTNRQKSLLSLAGRVDLVLVVGSKNSSNANRLIELAKKIGKKAYLIDSYKNIQESWLYGEKTIGITAGASAPDILIKQVVEHLYFFGAKKVEELIAQKENIIFKIPKELRNIETTVK